MGSRAAAADIISSNVARQAWTAETAMIDERDQTEAIRVAAEISRTDTGEDSAGMEVDAVAGAGNGNVMGTEADRNGLQIAYYDTGVSLIRDREESNERNETGSPEESVLHLLSSLIPKEKLKSGKQRNGADDTCPADVGGALSEITKNSDVPVDAIVHGDGVASSSSSAHLRINVTRDAAPMNEFGDNDAIFAAGEEISGKGKGVCGIKFLF